MVRAGFIDPPDTEVTNIIQKVTMISMIRACRSVPEGVVVPKCFTCSSNTRRANEAEMEPVICAAAYIGTFIKIKLPWLVI
ncbi:hypothetical protein Hanom_Chr17g01551841 [Helianthus anomalus]